MQKEHFLSLIWDSSSKGLSLSLFGKTPARQHRKVLQLNRFGKTHKIN